MASWVHNVSNQARLDIPKLQQVRRLGRQVRNLLVLNLLLLEQLSRIPLGLLDRPNLLLKDVELSSGRLLLVLDCSSANHSPHSITDWKRRQSSGTPLTPSVLVKERNDLVDEFDAGSSLLLRLADNLRVATLVSLD